MVSPSWTVRAIWFSSLVLALTSVSIATQQAVALSRLSSHPNATTMIFRLLDKRSEVQLGAQLEPSLLQLYIWQIPVSLLTGSLYFFITGLAVLLWNKSKVVHLSWSEGDTKVR